MPIDPLLLGVGGLVAAGALVAYALDPERRARRALMRAPMGDLEGAVEGGMLRISGVVREAVGEPVRGVIEPIGTGVAVKVTVVRFDRPWIGRGHRVTSVLTEHTAVPFVLEVGAARARVEPGRQRTFATARRAHKEILWQQGRAFDALLERHGHDAAKLARAEELEVCESLIGLGDAVDVLGTVRWEDDPDGTLATDGYRGATRARRLVLVDATVVVNEGVPTSG